MDDAKEHPTDKLVGLKKETEPLTLDGLLKQLKGRGLVPVRVLEGFSVERKEMRFPTLLFDGTLSEFIETAAALNIKAVFVTDFLLDEEEFVHLLDPPRPEPKLSEHIQEEPLQEELLQKTPAGFFKEEAIDLTIREPLLANFRKYLGQPFQFELSFLCDGVVIGLLVPETWYEEFRELLIRTIDVLEEERDAAILEQKAKSKAEAETTKNEGKKVEADQQTIDAFKKILENDYDAMMAFFREEYILRDYILKKYPEIQTKLDHTKREELLDWLVEERDKREQEEEEQEEAEKKQRMEEAEKLKKKIANLKETLLLDPALMSLRHKSAMRAYLIDKHPELFEKLIPVRTQQNDFVEWLFLKKKKS